MADQSNEFLKILTLCKQISNAAAQRALLPKCFEIGK
jgi:hypothetical protein